MKFRRTNGNTELEFFTIEFKNKRIPKLAISPVDILRGIYAFIRTIFIIGLLATMLWGAGRRLWNYQATELREAIQAVQTDVKRIDSTVTHLNEEIGSHELKHRTSEIADSLKQRGVK